MKNFWLSALAVPEQQVRGLLLKLQTYGLKPSAHEWSDNNAAMDWMGPKEALCAAQFTFWAIMGAKAAFVKQETRYGVSLLALCVQSVRGPGFPIVILQTDAEPMSGDDLPTPLQGALILPAADAGTPAKLAAKVHGRLPVLPAAYHFDMMGNPQLGQWFSLRPTRGQWPGVIFGVDEGQIKFQAVGPAGALPTTSTLNFPMQGIKIDLNGRNYTAWAVRNSITPDTAYYVKVEGYPGTLLFGAFSEESETELYAIALK